MQIALPTNGGHRADIVASAEDATVSTGTAMTEETAKERIKAVIVAGRMFSLEMLL